MMFPGAEKAFCELQFAKCESIEVLQRRFHTQFIYQQDEAPSHFHHDLCGYLSYTLPQRWIGRASQDDYHLLPWPPRLPDLTTCDFLLWGYVKDQVFVPLCPSI